MVSRTTRSAEGLRSSSETPWAPRPRGPGGRAEASGSAAETWKPFLTVGGSEGAASDCEERHHKGLVQGLGILTARQRSLPSTSLSPSAQFRGTRLQHKNSRNPRILGGSGLRTRSAPQMNLPFFGFLRKDLSSEPRQAPITHGRWKTGARGADLGCGSWRNSREEGREEGINRDLPGPDRPALERASLPLRHVRESRK